MDVCACEHAFICALIYFTKGYEVAYEKYLTLSLGIN